MTHDEQRRPATERPEARTKAGQEMESWLREPEDYEWGRKVTNAILAIEAEAAAERDRLEAALRRLLDRYTMRPLLYREKYRLPDRSTIEGELADEDADRTEVIAAARAALGDGR